NSGILQRKSFWTLTPAHTSSYASCSFTRTSRRRRTTTPGLIHFAPVAPMPTFLCASRTSFLLRNASVGKCSRWQEAQGSISLSTTGPRPIASFGTRQRMTAIRLRTLLAGDCQGHRRNNTFLHGADISGSSRLLIRRRLVFPPHND